MVLLGLLWGALGRVNYVRDPLGPRASRGELPAAPRRVVSSAASHTPRSRARCKLPSPRRIALTLVHASRAPPRLVGRAAPAPRRCAPLELGTAVRRLPELPGPRAPARVRGQHALRQVRRRLRDRVGRRLLHLSLPQPARLPLVLGYIGCIVCSER